MTADLADRPVHAAARQVRRDVSGIVLVDKPAGATSNRVLQTVKRIFAAKKAGHTGSLDPLATGMLPVCLGEATKVSGLLLDARKSYRVEAMLGVATDTGDADGNVVATGALPPLSRDDVVAAFDAFRGEIDQVPPMFSALKHEGRRLYTLARRGETVERPPRRVTIHDLVLEAFAPPRLRFEVECSKGTYVRSLVGDIAARLGTVGHVTSLRRLTVGPYRGAEMHDVDALAALGREGAAALDEVLLPTDSALAGWSSIELDAEQARRLGQGQAIAAPAEWPDGCVRLYGPGPEFLGVGTVGAERRLRSTRLLAERRLESPRFRDYNSGLDSEE